MRLYALVFVAYALVMLAIIAPFALALLRVAHHIPR